MRIILLSLIFFLYACASTNNLVSSNCTKTYIIGYDDTPPFSERPKKGQKPIDIDIDIITEALDRMQCKYEFKYSTWENLLFLARTGAVDILTSANVTDQRQEFALFSNTYLHSLNKIFVARQNFNKFENFKTLEDLEQGIPNIKIGAIIGYEYGNLFHNFKKEYSDSTVLFRSRKEMIKAAESNKIDAFFDDIIFTQEQLSKMKIKSSKYVALNIRVQDQDDGSHFLFSKKNINTNFLNDFNKVLKTLKDDLVIDNIVFKYHQIPEAYIQLILVHE